MWWNCGARNRLFLFSAADWFVLWLLSGLFLYWVGIHRVASPISAAWEQRISYAAGQLLTGMSLPGGWLRGCRRQVTVQSIQSPSLCSKSCHGSWLDGGGTGAGEVSVVRHFELQTITPGDLQKTPKVAFASCMWQDALCPLCTQGFWPWALLQVQVTQLAGWSTVLYLIGSIKYSQFYQSIYHYWVSVLPFCSWNGGNGLWRLLVQSHSCSALAWEWGAGTQPRNLGEKHLAVDSLWVPHGAQYSLWYYGIFARGSACLQLWESQASPQR